MCWAKQHWTCGCHWATSPSDDGKTKKQGVPPAEAVHSHPEGKCDGGAGDCGEEWQTGSLLGVIAACMHVHD